MSHSERLLCMEEMPRRLFAISYFSRGMGEKSRLMKLKIMPVNNYVLQERVAL